jgi:hypothetical protein
VAVNDAESRGGVLMLCGDEKEAREMLALPERLCGLNDCRSAWPAWMIEMVHFASAIRGSEPIA